MIAKLKGLIESIGDTSLIVDVQGVGYRVFCSGRTLSQLGDVGEPVTLHIETQVREDAITLFGFQNIREQEWFSLLTTVQGVGAKVALAILSCCEEEALAQAIQAQDKAFMTQAEGVGPKLATRIVNELKEKVEKLGFSIASSSSQRSLPSGRKTLSSNREDALSALLNLGYKRTEALLALQSLSPDQDNAPVEVLIREGLKILSLK